MRALPSPVMAFAVAVVVALGCSTSGNAAGTCSRDWCVKDALSCWCGAADAGRCDTLSSPSTARHWGSGYWVTREDCANHIRFEWFGSTGPHRDLFDLAGKLIGHVDYTDVGVCTAKRYGEVPEETCGPCVLLRGDPNAKWPMNPPMNCHPTNDGGVDAGGGSSDGSADATGDGS